MNYQTGGMEPFGYHLINLIIHIVNSLLVYGVILYSARKFQPDGGGGYWPALFGALIFALHPIQTQAVSYIAQRAASLAATFYLAGLLFYIRAKWRRPKFIILSPGYPARPRCSGRR